MKLKENTYPRIQRRSHASIVLNQSLLLAIVPLHEVPFLTGPLPPLSSRDFPWCTCRGGGGAKKGHTASSHQAIKSPSHQVTKSPSHQVTKEHRGSLREPHRRGRCPQAGTRRRLGQRTRTQLGPAGSVQWSGCPRVQGAVGARAEGEQFPAHVQGHPWPLPAAEPRLGPHAPKQLQCPGIWWVGWLVRGLVGWGGGTPS